MKPPGLTLQMKTDSAGPHFSSRRRVDSSQHCCSPRLLPQGPAQQGPLHYPSNAHIHDSVLEKMTLEYNCIFVCQWTKAYFHRSVKINHCTSDGSPGSCLVSSMSVGFLDRDRSVLWSLENTTLIRWWQKHSEYILIKTIDCDTVAAGRQDTVSNRSYPSTGPSSHCWDVIPGKEEKDRDASRDCSSDVASNVSMAEKRRSEHLSLRGYKKKKPGSSAFRNQRDGERGRRQQRHSLHANSS